MARLCAHFVIRPKPYVNKKGYAYEYKELGKDFTREEVFEKFPSARTFPQIRVDGENIGGYTELEAWHNNQIGAVDI